MEYEKGPGIRYISHLDMVRLWERLFRRSGLPLVLTQGFNPHPKISLGTVLPVGLWGKREYLDVELTLSGDGDVVRASLEEAAPPGIKVGRLKEIAAGTPSLMSAVNASAYRFAFPPEMEKQVREVLVRLQQSPEILVKGKKNEGANDIRPGIIELRVPASGEGTVELEAVVHTGGEKAVRYSDLLAALGVYGLHREEMSDSWREANYVISGKILRDPLEI